MRNGACRLSLRWAALLYGLLFSSCAPAPPAAPASQPKQQQASQTAAPNATQAKPSEPQATGSTAPQSALSPPSAVVKAAADAPVSPVGPTSWATFRNGNQQLGVASSTLPDKLELLWERPAIDGVVAGAAIVGNQVYVGILHGDLLALDRKTGQQLWSYRSIDDPNPETFAPGFKASPTVTTDSVYIGDEDGVMHAVDRKTGLKKWIFTTGAEIAGSAAVVGEKLVFGSHDSYLYCIKIADGTLAWKFQTEDRVNCSPAIEGNSTFVAGCDTKLRVIDIDGPKQTRNIPLGDGAYLIASPAVVGSMLYVGTHDGRVVGVDWQKGEIAWTFKDPKREQPYHASAAVTDEFVIVGGQDKLLHCLDRKSGNQVWSFPARGQINSSPVVVGERIFFGSADGNIYAVGLRDGKEAWKYTAGKDVTASPAVGENCLVIGTEGSKGTIYCFGKKDG